MYLAPKVDIVDEFVVEHEKFRSEDSHKNNPIKKLINKLKDETSAKMPMANHKQQLSENKKWIQSATTTFRPAYDQIPRPILFDDEEGTISITNTDIFVDYG